VAETLEFTSAEAHGQRFVYADSGEGPLVVLVHGFPDTPNGWARTRGRLNAAGYRTVVPFLRGYHPDTIVPGRSYARPQIGEDAIRLLDAVGAEQAMLVGHDWGAAVVYSAATLAPERVRAVCAVAIPHPSELKPTPRLAWDARHFLTLRLPTGRWLARRRDFAYLDTLMRRWAPRWSGPERDATLADAKRCFSDPRTLDGALSYYRDAVSGGAPRLTQPALIFGGSEDIVPSEAFTRSADRVEAHCEVVVQPGVGHWPHREAAEAFEERLVAFLGGLASP
jgi:pimeloyl-ACP methyl ester carboxylesterase